jgi:hypothetical protein
MQTSGGDGFAKYHTISSSNTWEEYKHCFTSSADAPIIRMNIGTSPLSAVDPLPMYMDDIKLDPINHPTAYRLIGSTSTCSWFELSEVELFDQNDVRVSPNLEIKTTLYSGNGADIQNGLKWAGNGVQWHPYSAFAGKALVEWDGGFELTRASLWTSNVPSFGTNPRIEKQVDGVWSNAGITIAITYAAEGNRILDTPS